MAKTLAMVFGVVFVLVGVLGFISNPIVGETGLFHTDLMHNLVHIIIGIVLVVASRKSDMAAMKSMKIIAIIYALLAVLGFLMLGSAEGTLLGLVESNGADNWLHLVLAVVLWVAATVGGKKSMMGSNAPMGGQM